MDDLSKTRFWKKQKRYQEFGLLTPRFSRMYFSGDSMMRAIKVARLFWEITDPFSGSAFPGGFITHPISIGKPGWPQNSVPRSDASITSAAFR